jgi:hypothetical protein
MRASHIGRSVGSAAGRVREHTTAAAPPRDAMFARLHQSLSPRQRQCLRYCEAERFRGLKLTTSSKFHDPAHAAQDHEPSQVSRLGGTSPCRSFPARGGLPCGCPSLATRRCRSSQRSSPRGPVRAPLRRSRRSSGCLPDLPRGVGCERVAAPAGAGGGRRGHLHRQLSCEGVSQFDSVGQRQFALNA